MKRVVLFLTLWLAVGFSIGTATLLGPVRWITTWARQHGVGEGLEKAAVQLVIVLLVAVTATAAWILTRIVRATDRLEVRGGVPVLCAAAAIGAAWIWMTP